MTGGGWLFPATLENSDYYDEQHRVRGEWHGRGAELLGLTGEVTRDQFEAVREGLHPETAEFLRPRHSADRIANDGNEQSKARSLYDLTFSAPKSVSIQALVGGDERLIAAHDKAVREALGEAETYAATRVRLDGANENRTTANWVVAAYRHDASRELDPQLHTHAVAANLSYDGVEGRWKALQASGLYERRAYLTEVYRNALAREVRGLGYEIDNRRDAKGRDYGFEIRGVSDELLGRNTVSEALSGTRPSRDSLRNVAASQPITRSPFWFANRARINWPKSQQNLCGSSSSPDCRRTRAWRSPNFAKNLSDARAASPRSRIQRQRRFSMPRNISLNATLSLAITS